MDQLESLKECAFPACMVFSSWWCCVPYLVRVAAPFVDLVLPIPLPDPFSPPSPPPKVLFCSVKVVHNDSYIVHALVLLTMCGCLPILHFLPTAAPEPPPPLLAAATDPYLGRRLPFYIGTQAFFASEHCGLVPGPCQHTHRNAHQLDQRTLFL